MNPLAKVGGTGGKEDADTAGKAQHTDWRV